MKRGHKLVGFAPIANQQDDELSIQRYSVAELPSDG